MFSFFNLALSSPQAAVLIWPAVSWGRRIEHSFNYSCSVLTARMLRLNKSSGLLFLNTVNLLPFIASLLEVQL